jgi:hypothetical protein
LHIRRYHEQDASTKNMNDQDGLVQRRINNETTKGRKASIRGVNCTRPSSDIADFMDSTWSLWSSEPEALKIAPPKITLEKHISHEPHPSVFDDPAPGLQEKPGVARQLSVVASHVICWTPHSPHSTLYPQAQRTRYSKCLPLWLALKYHMLVAGNLGLSSTCHPM